MLVAVHVEQWLQQYRRMKYMIAHLDPDDI